jgi:hypothetical protein
LLIGVGIPVLQIVARECASHLLSTGCFTY